MSVEKLIILSDNETWDYFNGSTVMLIPEKNMDKVTSKGIKYLDKEDYVVRYPISKTQSNTVSFKILQKEHLGWVILENVGPGFIEWSAMFSELQTAIDTLMHRVGVQEFIVSYYNQI